jgi:hypothetical protein
MLGKQAETTKALKQKVKKLRQHNETLKTQRQPSSLGTGTKADVRTVHTSSRKRHL